MGSVHGVDLGACGHSAATAHCRPVAGGRCAFVPALMGMLLGQWVGRVSPRVFRTCFFAGSLILALIWCSVHWFD
jgi:uncharacterized membrane protein YfcA